MSASPKCCVYTVLYDDVDSLPEYPADIRETIDFVAFVDDLTITSQTWSLRHLPPRFPADLPRSSRWVKLLPHLLLPDYDASLYVDCTVDLRVPPMTLFQELLFGQTDTLALIRHSEHDTLEQEVAAILRFDFDSPARILAQFTNYASTGFEASDAMVWGGMMLRWHHHPAVIALMQSWLEHVLLYSRRDQLSLPYLLRHSAAHPVLHAIDNRASPYHRWPSPRARRHADWRQQTIEPDSPAMQRIVAMLQDRLAEDALQQTASLRQTLKACQDENAGLHADKILLHRALQTCQDETVALHATAQQLRACQAELTARLADGMRQLDERDRLLADVRAALQAMRQSTSWRLTALVRGVGKAIRAIRGKVVQSTQSRSI